MPTPDPVPDEFVSIHAPTRGATQSYCSVYIWSISFNPRAHAGRDFAKYVTSISPLCFNPRAHAGRDNIVDVSYL